MGLKGMMAHFPDFPRAGLGRDMHGGLRSESQVPDGHSSRAGACRAQVRPRRVRCYAIDLPLQPLCNMAPLIVSHRARVLSHNALLVCVLRGSLCFLSAFSAGGHHAEALFCATGKME